MRHRYGIYLTRVLCLAAFLILNARPVLSNGEHGMHDEAEEKMEMGAHHHSAPSKEGFKMPPGAKEVKITLSGPFCHKHPEEITEGLMTLAGVLHVEAFSGRKYILVHYAGEAAKPEDMAAIVSGLKGSGWRCKGKLSSKRKTER